MTSDPPRAPLRRIRTLILAVCIAVGLVCYGLGVWQLDRLGQRRARNAQMRERMASVPADLGAALDSSEDQTYRPVTGTGSFDPEAALYLTSRSHNDVPGMHVVAPFRGEGSSTAVLVNLGWVSTEESGSLAADTWIPSGTVHLAGILRPSQTEPPFSWLADPTVVPGDPPRERWRVLSIERIQGQVAYPLAPYYLALTAPVEGSALVPAPEIDLTDGPHLSYAIQWFAFGTTAIVGGIAWVRSVRRKGL